MLNRPPLLTSQQLEAFSTTLRQEQRHLTRMINHLRTSGTDSILTGAAGELSSYDNHPADTGDIILERSKDIALRENEQILLERVEQALAKIDQGTYGYCDECHRPIAFARLEALPMAAFCLSCQQRRDVSDPTPRPLEEELLSPPFHRTFSGYSPAGNTAFDGEDSLQAALSHGSSDTPQDISGKVTYDKLWFNSGEDG